MLAELTVLTPTLADIEAAALRIKGVVNRTPLEHSAWLSEAARAPVYLKLECMQRTRSFKLRGAANAIALLSEDQRARGVVTASAGNHGQAVALAGALCGVASTVFVPAGAPVIKKARIRAFGGTLDDSSPDYDSAEASALAFARSSGQAFIHAYSDAAVVAGQGTIGLEIMEDLPGVSCIIAPVGGGGLAAGIGSAIRAHSHIRLIGVQSTETRAMHDAFVAGRIMDSPITPTLADGLAGCTDSVAYERLRSLLDRIDLVSEAALGPAVRALFEAEGVISEGAGVVGVAAILQRMVGVDGPTVVVVSGGNIDAGVLARVLSR